MRIIVIVAGLLGVGLLGACSQIVGGFSAFNLTTPKEPCTLTGSVRELNLSFNYTGTLKGVNLLFTPNGKSSVAVNIADLSAPPTGLRVNTLTAGEARLFINLATLEPSAASSQAIPQPNPRQIYPMDIELQAIGSNGERPGVLKLPNVDVANCYVP
ncbi:hypothetical protein [Meiothermus sp.]|uniref:hypothetical protein n=1 Tax=Meiothermus sp. TaxID=1955249 RepID=UPI00262D1315|nr:hypothetical protein [Meiothermus sp.]